MRFKDLIGRHLGRYQLQDLIGQGGMATVYRAYDTALKRPVALKILYPHFLSDEDLVERFRHEAITAAQLDHPNVVPIYDVGEQDGFIYIAMKLLAGQSLQDVLTTSGQLPLERTLNLARQIAAALDYAHGRGVVHRDIKPANIVIEPDGRAILTDFGIAKTLDAPGLTTSGVLLGTPEYMAPEQIDRALGALGPSSDIYAFAVLIHRMLTGKRLFDGTTTTQVLLGHLHARPTPVSTIVPGLPAALDAVLDRALAKEPAQRYASAGELISQLEAAAGTATLNQVAPAPPALSTVRKEADQPAGEAYPSSAATMRKSPQQVLAAPPPQPLGRAGYLGFGVFLVGLLFAGGTLWLALYGRAWFSSQDGLDRTTVTTGSGKTNVAAVPTTPSTATSEPGPSSAPSETAEPSATTVGSTPTLPGSTTTPAILYPVLHSATPIPRPTLTPQPPPTRRPPPTRPPPVPTATATPVPPTLTPSPTPCAVAMTGGFKVLWESNAEVRQGLGCPLNTEVGWDAAIQYYENGVLYWWGQTRTIFVLLGDSSGRWDSYDEAALPEATPEYECIPSMYKPEKGFGKLLAQYPAVAEALGRCGRSPEAAGGGAYQRFQNGRMIFMPATEYRAQKQIWVLLENRQFTRHIDRNPN